MEHFQQLIKDVLKDDQPSALATIVNVDGSAYRKEGASIILRKDHSRVGLLSGGCLEKDLADRVDGLFNSSKAVVYEYDLSSEDDLGWGIGAGCNGIVSVLVRDIDDAFRAFIANLYKIFLNKSPVLFIQSMTRLDQYLFISINGERFGNWDKEIPVSIEDFVHEVIPYTKLAKQKIIDGDACFIQLFWPKPTLYIIGAGEDSRPLAKLAADTGYAVHMLDWRAELCTKHFFPTVQSRKIGEITTLIEEAELSHLDSVVVMTHDFQRDTEIMKQLQQLDLFYIGILGSKKRTERLLGERIPSRIHSPVGLAINAEGPEEIAVSIVAQLIVTKRESIHYESRWDLSSGRKQSAHGYQ